MVQWHPPGKHPQDPQHPQALIGREGLISELMTRLADPVHRLLTLAGPGGAGKTRLAMHLAEQIAPRRAAFVVMLAPVRDAAHVMAAIAAAMGLQDDAGGSPRALVLGALRRQPTLLVLDNLEHLADAAALVAELLRAVPGLQVLATSRTWLGLRDEVVVTVPPLALPVDDSMKEILASPAVALFSALAARHGRPLGADDGDRRAAAEICRRLDGLPLAIELVSPRLRVMTPQVLAARLQQRLDLLIGGGADAPPHHRSLRQALGVSSIAKRGSPPTSGTRWTRWCCSNCSSACHPPAPSLAMASAAARGDRLQARRDLDQGEAVAVEHDDIVNLAAAAHLQARFHLADGRIDDALRLEQRTLQLLLAEGEARIAVQHCRWLAHLHAVRGEHEPAVRLMAASEGRYGDERFLSLTTVSADDRADWLQTAQVLRQAVPPADHERWWQESLTWSAAQALALSQSLRVETP